MIWAEIFIISRNPVIDEIPPAFQNIFVSVIIGIDGKKRKSQSL